MLRRFVIAGLIALLSAGTVGAQTIVTSVLTIDLDRLVNETKFGIRLNDELKADVAQKQAEFNQIEADLTAEEESLVKKRETVSADEFRVLSKTFDEKVVKIRAYQREQQNQVTEKLSNGQKTLLKAATPILFRLVRERGGSVLLDRKTVVLDLSAADITNDAIAALDLELGDGLTNAEKPAQ